MCLIRANICENHKNTQRAISYIKYTSPNLGLESQTAVNNQPLRPSNAQVWVEENHPHHPHNLINSERGHVSSKFRLGRLELDHLSLPLLLSAKLKVLGPLDGHLVLPLAHRALHPEHQLLGGLSLLPQDRLGLTSKTLLLAVVP